eukprot:1155757-Pyramimonas_sp.AAC.1
MPGGRAAERPKGRARRRGKGRATGAHRGTCQGDALRKVPMDVPPHARHPPGRTGHVKPSGSLETFPTHLHVRRPFQAPKKAQGSPC